MAKGYRKLVINNNGVEETWTWLYGRTCIAIRSPENKGYTIQMPSDKFNGESVTPKNIANYIYTEILKIVPPAVKESVSVKQVEKKDIPSGKVYIVFKKETFYNDDDGRWNSSETMVRIFNEPSKAKEYARELNQNIPKELEENERIKYSGKIKVETSEGPIYRYYIDYSEKDPIVYHAREHNLY